MTINGSRSGKMCATWPKTILRNWSVQITTGSWQNRKQGPDFLGAVVLKQVPTSAKDIDQREVIDGQQRVTTLQLLLDAIQQICEESDQPYLKKTARRLAKLVTNDEELIGDDELHIFKLWPTRGDREAFRHAMDNGLAVNDFEDSLIVQAHEFFQLQVRKWLDDAAVANRVQNRCA